MVSRSHSQIYTGWPSVGWAPLGVVLVVVPTECRVGGARAWAKWVWFGPGLSWLPISVRVGWRPVRKYRVGWLNIRIRVSPFLSVRLALALALGEL